VIVKKTGIVRMNIIKQYINTQRIFRVRYSITRAESQMYWCYKRKIWTTLDDNIACLSSSTHNMRKREAVKLANSIPLKETINILKTRYLFGKRTMTESRYKGE